MSTEAQRARNARKRAKLKAHRTNNIPEMPEEVVEYDYEFAARGCKELFPGGAYDNRRLNVTPQWAVECEYIPVMIRAPLDADLYKLKCQVAQYVEEVYGFNKWDTVVFLVQMF